jgi:hypothetical protein
MQKMGIKTFTGDDKKISKKFLPALNQEQYEQPENPESSDKPDGKLTMVQSGVNTCCSCKPGEYDTTQGNNAGFSPCFRSFHYSDIWY